MLSNIVHAEPFYDPFSDVIVRFFLNDRALMAEGFNFLPLNLTEDWDDDKWEGCHNHVQWAFPTNIPSQFNPNAPLVTANTIRTFKRFPTLLMMLDRLFLRFYDFLVNRANHKDTWLTPNNHNFLRITRVIQCMNMFGLRDNARTLYEWMSELYSDPMHAKIIGAITWKYWTDAYNDVGNS